MDELIQLIPNSERRKILLENYINKAVAIGDNYEMKCLMVYWRTYIEPTADDACNSCLERVHKNFRGMQERMIQLEKEESLLR
jgi:hypothetical protein